MLGLQHIRPASLPLFGQSVHVPLVVICDYRKQGDGEWMKVELGQDAVQEIGPFAVPVYLIKGIARGPDRQRGYIESFAVRGNSRDARSDTKEDVAELAQLFHRSIDILSIHSLRIKDRLCVIKHYEGLPGR